MMYYIIIYVFCYTMVVPDGTRKYWIFRVAKGLLRFCKKINEKKIHNMDFKWGKRYLKN